MVKRTALKAIFPSGTAFAEYGVLTRSHGGGAGGAGPRMAANALYIAIPGISTLFALDSIGKIFLHLRRILRFVQSTDAASI